MKFINNLILEVIITLQWMAKDHPLSWTRIRANAVLLSNKGIPVQMIASLYGICRQTVSIWLKNWDKNGVCGLVDKSGRGRRKIFASCRRNRGY